MWLIILKMEQSATKTVDAAAAAAADAADKLTPSSAAGSLAVFFL